LVSINLKGAVVSVAGQNRKTPSSPTRGSARIWKRAQWTAQVAKISKALADPTRWQIYETIAAKADMHCGEILEQHGLTPGTISHRLRTLSEAGLIECRREPVRLQPCPRGDLARGHPGAGPYDAPG
jgi:DNA-binding HxlR family transcriptional regulator